MYDSVLVEAKGDCRISSVDSASSRPCNDNGRGLFSSVTKCVINNDHGLKMMFELGTLYLMLYNAAQTLMLVIIQRCFDASSALSIAPQVLSTLGKRPIYLVQSAFHLLFPFLFPFSFSPYPFYDHHHNW